MWIQPQALTGNSRNEAKGPQYPEGSQGLHVKPPTLLRWRSCYHIDGIQSKSEESVKKKNIQTCKTFAFETNRATESRFSPYPTLHITCYLVKTAAAKTDGDVWQERCPAAAQSSSYPMKTMTKSNMFQQFRK